MVAVTMWPLFSLALTLPILAYLYHRDGRIKFASAVAVYLSVLYVLGLGCFTLYPLPSGESGPGITYGIPWQTNPLAFVGDIAREGVSAIPQIAFNVVFFVPLGFIAGRLLRWGFVRTAVVGLLTSCLIEAAQGTGLFGIYPYAYRTADVNDLMWNTSGAVIGWWCAALLARVVPPGALAEPGEVTDRPGFIRRCVAFWLDMTLVGIASGTVVGIVRLALWNVPGLEGAEAMWPPSVPWELAVGGTVFAIVEGVLPWLHAGSTPGGGFVRMTCETRARRGVRRLIFYIVRLAVLGLAWLSPGLAWPILGIFYLVARRMPYDLI